MPGGEAGDECAPILFDLSEPLGFDDGGRRVIPAYFTVEEISRLVEDGTSDGKNFEDKARFRRSDFGSLGKAFEAGA